MAYKVIILYRLYMPSYFLGTFTEYPYVRPLSVFNLIHHNMKLIVEVFFFNSDSIYIRNQLFAFRFAFMKVHIL